MKQGNIAKKKFSIFILLSAEKITARILTIKKLLITVFNNILKHVYFHLKHL
jgi:hypothetical protein